MTYFIAAFLLMSVSVLAVKQYAVAKVGNVGRKGQ